MPLLVLSHGPEYFGVVFVGVPGDAEGAFAAGWEGFGVGVDGITGVGYHVVFFEPLMMVLFF